jgi:hypothetical protein
VALCDSIAERILSGIVIARQRSDEAISCMGSLEIATPRQVGARNDRGVPQNLITHFAFSFLVFITALAAQNMPALL